MKYIFVTGAPGSKWSSVVKNIYYSTSIDQSDNTTDRSYAHKDQYSGAPMHLGSYFDPGMEFGGFFDKLSQFSKAECEAEFNRPFSGTGTRIIKSHVFAHHIDYIKSTWPDCPLVLVHRSTDACLGWWVRCGAFDISYPNYRPYYKDLATIGREIELQNRGIVHAWNRIGTTVTNNRELAQTLNITVPSQEFQHDYPNADIAVKVI